MQKKRRSRVWIILLAVMLVGAGLVYAFMPQPTLVDLGTVTRGDLIVSIREEGRTRVHDAYVLSTPVTGRLLRINVEPGDQVTAGETIVARMLPTSPAVLDARTREQARAAVDAAEAGLKAAESDRNLARSDLSNAIEEHNRALQLLARDLLSEAQIDQAERGVLAAQARWDTADAVVAMRKAELAQAAAQLVSFSGTEISENDLEQAAELIELRAPATGRILQIFNQSEVIAPAGTPIVEIGDTTTDLEIAVDLLSTEAVRVNAGDRVIIENTGLGHVLAGTVLRVNPSGFAKMSALGVEEQRVGAVIAFTDPPEMRAGLGHGFRVEVDIVVEEDNDALLVPSGALFRVDGQWTLFRVVEGKAVSTPVVLSKNNGIVASISEGLAEGDEVVLFPSSALVDGMSVAQRKIE